LGRLRAAPIARAQCGSDDKQRHRDAQMLRTDDDKLKMRAFRHGSNPRIHRPV
jgi:hypothetical protein